MLLTLTFYSLSSVNYSIWGFKSLLIPGWVLSLALADKGYVFFMIWRVTTLEKWRRKEQSCTHLWHVPLTLKQVYLLSENSLWSGTLLISQSRPQERLCLEGACVQISQPCNLWLLSPDFAADCEGTLWGEGRVPDLQELTNSTTEYQEKHVKAERSPQRCTWQTHHLKAHIWSRLWHQKQVLAFFFLNQTSSDFACTPFLSGSFWKGVSPTTHERCLALHHVHIKRYYCTINFTFQNHLLREDIFIYSK